MLLLKLLIFTCSFQTCDVDEMFSVMDSIYNDHDKYVIAKVNISRYSHYESDVIDSIRIDFERSKYLSRFLDTLIWQKLDSCEVCHKYWGNIIGEYRNIDPMKYYSQDIKEMIRYGYHNYLNGKPTKIDSLIKDYKNQLNILDSTLTYNSNADSIDGIYIPVDYDDAIKNMGFFYESKYRDTLKEMTMYDVIGKEHLGRGMWLRNEWSLWGRSRLALYLNSKEIKEPDKMSSVLILGYYLYLNDKPHSLEDAKRAYQLYLEDYQKRIDEKNKKKQ